MQIVVRRLKRLQHDLILCIRRKNLTTFLIFSTFIGVLSIDFQDKSH